MFSVLCDHNCKVQYSVGVAPSKPKKKKEWISERNLHQDKVNTEHMGIMIKGHHRKFKSPHPIMDLNIVLVDYQPSGLKYIRER